MRGLDIIHLNLFIIMFQVTIIGHLGANAEVGESNGRKYVRFRVATTKSFTKADGTKVENTQWHSCIMSGDGGGLLQYLVKGQQVCVIGNADLGVVSSPKLKRMVATSDIQVNSISLVGGRPEGMPQAIAAPDGSLHTLFKAYYITEQEAAQYTAEGPATFYDASGGQYLVHFNGYVLKLDEVPEQGETTQSKLDDVPEQGETTQSKLDDVPEQGETTQSNEQG